jgi:hypothetical protein
MRAQHQSLFLAWRSPPTNQNTNRHQPTTTKPLPPTQPINPNQPNQIHNWSGDLSADNFEFVAPTKVYVVNRGQITVLDLMQLPALTPRQIQALGREDGLGAAPSGVSKCVALSVFFILFCFFGFVFTRAQQRKPTTSQLTTTTNIKTTTEQQQ